MEIQAPYFIEEVITKTIIRKYNPNYGDDRICRCGHSYYRHFDTWEDMSAVGCKYCGCWEFREADFTCCDNPKVERTFIYYDDNVDSEYGYEEVYWCNHCGKITAVEE